MMPTGTPFGRTEKRKGEQIKKIALCFLMSLVGLSVFSGCSAEPDRNSYWKGDLPCDYSVYADTESFYYKYSGHMEYKTINSQPVSFVFGFEADLESTVVYVSQDPFDYILPPVPAPVLVDGTWGYEDKFGFTETPIQLFSGPVSTNGEFAVGLWEFWNDVGEDCTLHFSFDNVSMTGHFVNSSPDWGEYGFLTTNSIFMQHESEDHGWS